MSKKQDQNNFLKVYDEFISYVEMRRKRQGFDTFTRNFKNHILPYFKDKKLSELTIQDIINWQNKILHQKFSNSFNNSLYYNFSSFMKYCVLNSYMKENLVLSVGKFPKKIEKKKSYVYTIWEFRKFRRNLKDFVIKQFFNFMYFYGTRPSEAMALRFSDFDGLSVNISHSLQRRGKRELDTTKNQASTRIFKISILMWLRIYKLKKYYTKEYGHFRRDYFVFGGKIPLSTTTVDRRKKEACERANIHEITQHQFRHSCATRLIHKNIPIDYVSRSLGHSRVSTTVDIYLHQEKRMRQHSFFKINF